MKKFVTRLFIPALVLCWMLPAITVFAGNINSEEQRLLDAANMEYLYNDKKYIVTENAKQRARNYLMQDDVDLTKEDVDSAIDQIYYRIEEGISKGYLIPVSTPGEDPIPVTPEPEEPVSEEIPTEETSEINTEKNTEESSDESESEEFSETNPEDVQAINPETGEEVELFSPEYGPSSESLELLENALAEDKADEEDKQNMDKDFSYNKGFDFKVAAFWIVGVVLAVSAVIIVINRLKRRK